MGLPKPAWLWVWQGTISRELFITGSGINLSYVFHTPSRVSNNRTVIIICFVLKSSIYNAYLRPRDYQLYFLTSSARLFYSAQFLISEFSVDKQH